jgi:cytochrome b
LPLANDLVSQPDRNGFAAGRADETIGRVGLFVILYVALRMVWDGGWEVEEAILAQR